MLAQDLAEMYQVNTKALNQQVKRNIGKFPDRYMFQLTEDEYYRLRSQNVTLKIVRELKEVITNCDILLYGKENGGRKLRPAN